MDPIPEPGPETVPPMTGIPTWLQENISLLYNHPPLDDDLTEDDLSFNALDTHQNLMLYRLDVIRLSRHVEKGLQRIQALEDPEVVQAVRHAHIEAASKTRGKSPHGHVVDGRVSKVGDQGASPSAGAGTNSDDGDGTLSPSTPAHDLATTPDAPLTLPQNYETSLQELYTHTYMVSAKISQCMSSLSNVTAKASEKEKEALVAGYTKREFNQEWFERLRKEEEEEVVDEVSGGGEWGVDGVGDPGVWKGEGVEEREGRERREEGERQLR